MNAAAQAKHSLNAGKRENDFFTNFIRETQLRKRSIASEETDETEDERRRQEEKKQIANEKRRKTWQDKKVKEEGLVVKKLIF